MRYSEACASSSEAASTAPAESSVVEETTPEEAPSEVTDVDEAAAEDLLLSTETMHYSADDEDGVVTVHKYDENGNEVFMREIDKASDMDTVIIKELDENGNVLKITSYLNGEQNYLYTQVFNDHGDLIERDDEDGNPSIVCQYTYDDNGRKLSEESYTLTPPTIEIVGFLGGAARFITKPYLKQRVMRFPIIRYGCSA